MTMPKANRRSIHVDGEDYHWMERFEQSGRVTIQHASGQGSCLIVMPLDIILPGNIAVGIRFAIQAGWHPESPGDNIWLAFQNREPMFRKIPVGSEFRYNHELTRWEVP